MNLESAELTVSCSGSFTEISAHQAIPSNFYRRKIIDEVYSCDCWWASEELFPRSFIWLLKIFRKSTFDLTQLGLFLALAQKSSRNKQSRREKKEYQRQKPIFLCQNQKWHHISSTILGFVGVNPVHPLSKAKELHKGGSSGSGAHWETS